MSLVRAVSTTFGTYMLADYLSNFIQHPTQKMDYGIFNKLIGREVGNAWWGTRTEHIVGVAACLAVTDHMSQGIFGKILGRPLCFEKSPAPFIAHTFLFIFSGVTVYVAADAALNPDHEGKRTEEFKSGTYSSMSAPAPPGSSRMFPRHCHSSARFDPTMSLSKAVATTFGTYMCADFLSNFIQHPTQKMDYGIFNQLIGREVGNAWWGTRTEHIVGVAACLAVTDHMSQSVFSKFLGRPLCFAKSPGPFVAHTFIFIFSGVTAYVAADAALNPDHEGKRMEEFKSGTYSSYVGSNTAFFEPYVSPALAKVAGTGIANSWFGSALLPATLAYSTVKGVGWYDWGDSGLNDLEMKINKLTTGHKA
eukprot:CAMPEP_0181299030 /NCGR_PEP_ID=MMETSP1101-20121128/6114_1 /TAXON_ID=46948 /ORGANISM="Rhodomonas abbreviata, Strain Caron Lab Isolate" /LENGTH=363 /DNA_ID=CAMNT_0023404123 /DNA_START=13 /DNA_END=1105 /DNA_ORIENTATION=+